MRSMLVPIALGLSVAACAQTGTAVVSGPPQAASPAVERGERIARRVCAGCHAVTADSDSPRMSAPSFRTLRFRYNRFSLQRRMTELAPGEHREMPPLQMDPAEIDDLLAYIETVEGS